MSGQLCVENLGKAYRRYAGEWRRVLSWFGVNATPLEEQWVLRNVAFSVAPGEAVGIIGQNGAGKSTLLKLITGTARPTEGRVHVSGRIAAILELGMGFNPEMTGRQNAHHAAGLLGYSHADIERVMPEIEAFAEIGEYFDQPVRIYSSGMQARLAFSVATAFRPDLLIVDEALSVGDAYFQHKSFDRIREFRKHGTTLLIVSHDRQAILNICDRVILLNGGKLAMQGEPEAMMDYYNAMFADHQNQTIIQTVLPDGKQRVDSGTREAEIRSIELFDENGRCLDVVSVGQRVVAVAEVKVNKDINGLVLGFGIKDRLGQMIFGTNTFHTGQVIQKSKVGDEITFRVSFEVRLGVGSYSIHCSLVENESHVEKNYHWIDRAKVFEVINVDKNIFVGCVWNELDFQIVQR